jgi:hypothetical protein
MEMIERFLFHRVDGECTRLAIHLADKRASVVATTAAQSYLAIGNATVMRTELASHSPVLQTLIISALVHHHFSLSFGEDWGGD